jgi:Zn finger protein HypA/HybF involved in hydrogenase expression
MRLLVKNLMCWLGCGDWLTEYCQDCGASQPIVWRADATLWHDVGCEQSTILCPRCFSERAELKGYFIQWSPDGWALVDWNLTTEKDRERERRFFDAKPDKAWLAQAADAEDTVAGGNYVPNDGKAIIPSGTAMYWCDRCDGTGTYEGGKTLLTVCEKCKGTGLLELK